MKIEKGLAESAAEEYPLSADELDQVVTEIKTSDAYTEKLSGKDLSQAVGNVLADNEMMRRKGRLMKAETLDYKSCYFPGSPNMPPILSWRECPVGHGEPILRDDYWKRVISPEIRGELLNRLLRALL